MTEIPEHLLKRSRAAKGKSDPDEGGGEAPSAAVESTAAAAPAPSGPPAMAAAAAAISPDPEPAAAPPEPHYIQAANARKKLPLWAFLLVGALPLWAISFAGTMQQPEVEDVLFIDAELAYTQTGGCAGCHGAAGGGGTGYAFTDGEVLASFPQVIDQMAHVARGSTAIDGQQYGDPNRPGGARVSGARGAGAMPAQLNVLTLNELEMVIFHERAVLGGEDTESEAYQEWMEHMREAAESGDATPLDDAALELILRCADPVMTPGGGGEVVTDGAGNNICPGPHVDGGGEELAGG